MGDPHLWETQPQHYACKAIQISHCSLGVHSHLDPAVDYLGTFVQIRRHQYGHCHQQLQALGPVVGDIFSVKNKK